MSDLIPEDGLRDAVDLLVRLVESAGAIVIFVGAAIAFLRFVVAALRDRQAASFVPVRLDLGARIVVLVAAAAVGRWRDGLTSSLGLWVAAGLLRLTSRAELDRLAAAAAIIGIRHLVVFGLAIRPTEERR